MAQVSSSPTSLVPDNVHTIDQSAISINEHGNGKHPHVDVNMPPGYRFCPLDSELVYYYLKPKVMKQPLPIGDNHIPEVVLSEHNPEELTKKHAPMKENNWYFFTPRDRKYQNGSRPNRRAGDGYWKATGADKEVEHESEVIGYRKSLVFYKGDPQSGEKTQWIMHEFRLKKPSHDRVNIDDMRLDDWVLCLIYYKPNKQNGTKRGVGPTASDLPQLPPPGLPDQDLINSRMLTNFYDNASFNYQPITGSHYGRLAIDDQLPLETIFQSPPAMVGLGWVGESFSTNDILPQHGGSNNQIYNNSNNIEVAGDMDLRWVSAEPMQQYHIDHCHRQNPYGHHHIHGNTSNIDHHHHSPQQSYGHQDNQNTGGNYNALQQLHLSSNHNIQDPSVPTLDPNNFRTHGGCGFNNSDRFTE